LDKPETVTPRPLRILLVVNLPWDTRLGAVRVYLELMERWRAAGHIVEKFSLSEAFPNARFVRAHFAIRQVLFAYKAAAFVRANAHRFDIVDAVIGSLHGSKQKLRFHGLLVARSVGLLQLYERYEPKGQTRSRGKIAGRVLYTAIRQWLKRASAAAVRHADVVNVPNEDEAHALREDAHVDLAIIVQPYGLTNERRHALAQAAAPAEHRLAQRKISFIGMWGPRKGAFDWPKIIRHIWQRIPDARFSFLGTMTASEKIFADLGLRSSERVELVPEYSSEQLSTLLADCAVGVFPSYVEGFGLAILEQLAAGIPTITFDVPGPREIFGRDDREFLVAAGDAETMAQRAMNILDLAPAEYEALSARCRSIAEKFQWEQIAADTIEQYRGEIAKLGRIVFTQPFGVASVEGGGGGRILRSLLRDAPLPYLCVSTLPEKPQRKFENEIHLPVRPSLGRIEHSRFVALPHALAPLFRRRFTQKLERVCHDVNARALHAIAHGGIDFHHAYRIAKKLKLPFFLQVHDDAVYTGGGRAPRRAMSRCLAEAWSGADARFVVSKELGEEYNRRYGSRDFVVVTDGVDQLAAAPRSAPMQLRIYFMGLFHLEYEPNLQALIDAVDLVDLAPDVPRSISLRCGFVRPHLHKPRVHVLPYGSEADVQSDFAEVDWLYLPLPFDEEHRAFVTYSLSTKMVSYLASGIPIIYHGPPGTAVFNLLAQHRAAALITTLDAKEIARTLRELLGSADAETFATNALALARRDFQRRDQHDKFWEPVLNRLSA
jgi:glycosyltransferase involved in cell wall biosynthesis